MANCIQRAKLGDSFSWLLNMKKQKTNYPISLNANGVLWPKGLALLTRERKIELHPKRERLCALN
jgi:hypothetical protein